jgi:hypothetical protein
MMRETQCDKQNVATINLQLYNASNNASVMALVRSCGTTELRKTANLWKTTVLLSLIILREHLNNRNE